MSITYPNGIVALDLERDLGVTAKSQIPMCETPGPRSGTRGHGTKVRAQFELQRPSGRVIGYSCAGCVGDHALAYSPSAD